MISEKLKKAILTELKLDDFNIEDSTMANQIPGWDSLNHINVITAIEKDYGLRFKAIEILKCKNIGDLQRLIDSKQNKQN